MTIQTPFRTIKSGFDCRKNPLYEAICALEPRAVINTVPLTWHKAKDFSVFDDKGNRWIDMTSAIFVTNAGHANPRIVEAIQKQLQDELLFAYNYPTELKKRFLEKLLAISPQHFDRVDLLITGSEAMDTAYKLVKLWGKKQGRKYLVTLSGSYHGRGLSNDFICGRKEKAAWSNLDDAEVIFLDFPYRDGDRFDPSRLPPVSEIAGFFLETFQGWGAWFYPPEYIEQLTRFAREGGALICFDEMQAGFWRLGTPYGYQSYGSEIRPDLICLGKGISSSLPVAAVLSRRDIVDVDPTADLHGTHSGNTLCLAAALANLEFLSSQEFQQSFAVRFRHFENAMKSLASEPGVKQVNARGMIAGLIFDTPKRATDIVFECINNGVLPVCTNRQSIKLAPPLTISEVAIDEAVSVIRSAIRAVGDRS